MITAGCRIQGVAVFVFNLSGFSIIGTFYFLLEKKIVGFLFLFCLFRAHPQHMEVPRLGGPTPQPQQPQI